MAEIRFNNASCHYSGAVSPAVSQLDLTVADGELVVLHGPSGSGKSTALRMLAGLVPVTSGEITIGGQRVGDSAASPPAVSMVFQNYALYPNLTVDQNIAIPLTQQRVAKAEIAERVWSVAAQLDLDGLLGRGAEQLSVGQRMRVALARALVRRPEVLLLDEPLANLEPTIRQEVVELLVTAQRRHGITCLYASADRAEALAMGDRLAILDQGVLTQIGSPEQFEVA